MTMKLEPLMTVHADLKAPVDIGTGPYGTRLVFDVTGGHFEGARLRGTLIPSGGDWLLIDTAGVGHLDVRITLETEDGARLYVQYYGVLVVNDYVNRALSQGGSTEYGETYFMTQPRYETGDARYQWLNSVMAVAEGRLASSAVEYQVFALVHG
jgi:uncharacterized protein DUF3237